MPGMIRILLATLALAAVCSVCAATPADMHAAVQKNDAAAVRALAAKDAMLINVIAPNGSGQTPLMAATLGGKTDVVRALLGVSGVDWTLGEKDGYTPAHGAAFQGRADIVPLLASAGVPVDEVHRDGYSPLHRAAWGTHVRHTMTVAALVEAGADPLRVSARDGKTALKMAQERGNKNTAELLERLEAEFRAEVERRAQTGTAAAAAAAVAAAPSVDGKDEL